MLQTCHHCGKDPYQYVNDGLKLIPVAVVCCEVYATETYNQLSLVEIREIKLLEDQSKKQPKVMRFGTLSLKPRSDTPDQCGSDEAQ